MRCEGPKTSNRITHLPPICMEDDWCWMGRLPLIHFNIIEWRMIDQVYHKFSCPQPILDPFADIQECDRLHKLRWEKNKREPWITRLTAY